MLVALGDGDFSGGPERRLHIAGSVEGKLGRETGDWQKETSRQPRGCKDFCGQIQHVPGGVLEGGTVLLKEGG